MPSTTFFNLPEEKRQRLLAAARSEFAHVPYPDVSINQIIRGAGIPRGSFYMYFQDKADLFRYLLQCHNEQFESELCLLLREHHGDLFAAAMALFDHIRDEKQSSLGTQKYEFMSQVIRLNQQLWSADLAAACASAHAGTPAFLALIDTSRLDLRGPEDLRDMLHILSYVTATAFHLGAMTGDTEAVRAQYSNFLRILQRGMSSKPAV
ncbi:MAG: TetR/AcrR family transcriptional regulator [Intestinimonas sp.]|nr:TetR/AcrR family transcriptional regulator [Intestinimonas sp.]